MCVRSAIFKIYESQNQYIEDTCTEYFLHKFWRKLMFVTWCYWLHLRFNYLEIHVLKENKMMFWYLCCFTSSKRSKHSRNFCAQKWTVSQILLLVPSLFCSCWSLWNFQEGLYCLLSLFLGSWFSFCLESTSMFLYLLSLSLSNLNWSKTQR